MNNFHYHQDPLYSAASSILEGVAEIQTLVKDFSVGDNTNFGKVLEIGADSITFKAKDLPKTRITFNQRKMGSSEFLLTKLVKLKEETESSEETLDEGTLGRVHRTRLYPPLKKSEDLVAELQTIIDAPDGKLWDVTSVSIRLSHDDIFDRFPKIYPYVKDMWAAIMTPDGARKTKEIAKKAIEAVHKHYPIKEETEASEESLDEETDLSTLRQRLSKHSEAAIAANREGDSEKVKYHQIQMNKIKERMANMVRNEEVETLDEAINWLGDYLTTSEKSQFGGYRPTIIDKKTKRVMYQSAAAYNTPQEAKDHAEDYLKQKSKGIKNPKVPVVGTYKGQSGNKNHNGTFGLNHRPSFSDSEDYGLFGWLGETEEENIDEETEIDKLRERLRKYPMRMRVAQAEGNSEMVKFYQDQKKKVEARIAELRSKKTNEEVTEAIDPALKRRKRLDMARVNAGAMSRDEYNKKYKLGKYRPAGSKLSGPGGLYKNLVKKEALNPDDEAGVWIDDFVKSDDPRFEGKSKEERIKMALGAWYAAQKKESSETSAKTLEEAVPLPSVKKVIDTVDAMTPKEYSNFLHALADNAFGISVMARRIKPKGPTNADAWEDVADGIRDAAKAYDARPIKMSEETDETLDETLVEARMRLVFQAVDDVAALEDDEFEEFLKRLADQLERAGKDTDYEDAVKVASLLKKAYSTWKTRKDSQDWRAMQAEEVETLDEAVYPLTKKALNAVFSLDTDELEEFLKELARNFNETGDKTGYNEYFQVGEHLEKAYKIWKTRDSDISNI